MEEHCEVVTAAHEEGEMEEAPEVLCVEGFLEVFLPSSSLCFFPELLLLCWLEEADRNEECGGDVLLLGGGGSGARLRSMDVLVLLEEVLLS